VSTIAQSLSRTQKRPKLVIHLPLPLEQEERLAESGAAVNPRPSDGTGDNSSSSEEEEVVRASSLLSTVFDLLSH
jgi:hypothetical protein